MSRLPLLLLLICVGIQARPRYFGPPSDGKNPSMAASTAFGKHATMYQEAIDAGDKSKLKLMVAKEQEGDKQLDELIKKEKGLKRITGQDPKDATGPTNVIHGDLCEMVPDGSGIMTSVCEKKTIEKNEKSPSGYKFVN